MKRRKAIKTFIIGAASAGVILKACDTADKRAPEKASSGSAAGRMPEEIAYKEKLQSETFFTAHEMATIGVLTDMIIPKDEVSGGAIDAGVPDFIEFIAKDKPEYATPLRGGIRWLDMICRKQFGKQFEKPFVECSEAQQMDVVKKIAYPKKAAPEHTQGVAFFSLMRNLTISGFYTSEIGFKDLGYMGNVPNQWNGVPDEVLQHYGLAYTEKELAECINYDKN